VSKLRGEDKYKRSKNSESFSFLAKTFNFHKSNVEYLIAL